MSEDRGTAAVEYMSTVGIFLVVLVCCLEAYVSFSTVEKVEDAARTGARVGSMVDADEGKKQAEAALPGWLNDHKVTVNRVGDSEVAEIEAKIPLLAKGVPFEFSIKRRVEMPVGG